MLLMKYVPITTFRFDDDGARRGRPHKPCAQQRQEMFQRRLHGRTVCQKHCGRLSRRGQSLSRCNQEQAPLGLSKTSLMMTRMRRKRGPVRSVAEVRWLSIPLEDGEVVSDTSKDTTNYYLFIQPFNAHFPPTHLNARTMPSKEF